MKNEVLTPREIEFVTHIANGLSHKQIAAALLIAKRTVSNHSLHINNKLKQILSLKEIGVCEVTHYVIGKGWAKLRFVPEPLALTDNSTATTLSNRETQIATHVANGLVHKEIAETLSISHHCVDKYRDIVGKKLRKRFKLPCVGIAEITHYAIANGLVKLKFGPEQQNQPSTKNGGI